MKSWSSIKSVLKMEQNNFQMQDEKRENYNFSPKFVFDSASMNEIKRSDDLVASLESPNLDGHLHVKNEHLIQFHVNDIFVMFVTLGGINDFTSA